MVTLRQEVNTPDRLRANLAAQTAAAQDMDALLTRERERIAARDWLAVQTLAAEKVAAASKLHHLMRELLALTTDAPGSHLAALGLNREWDTLLAQARRLQTANRESRVLLDRHHARASAALQMLNRGTSPSTYGRNGMAGLGGLRQTLAAA